MNDDRILEDLSSFMGKTVTVTFKMDGENTSIYSDGYVHARSTEHNPHPGRTYVSSLAGTLASQIPEGWRLCGENLQAIHTIEYDGVEDWFLLFGVFDDKNTYLDWESVQDWAKLLGIKTVEVVPGFEDILFDEDKIKSLVEVYKDNKKVEGFVVRNSGSFSYKEYGLNVIKFVYKHFEIPSEHWMHSKVRLQNRKT